MKWVGRIEIGLAVSLLLLAQPGHAAEDGRLARYWNAEVAIGYSSWPDLGNLVPAGRGGDFEDQGVGIRAKVDTSLARIGSATVFAGLELGFTGFNSDVIFESGATLESALELSHLAATLTFRFGDPGRRHVGLDMGVGAYTASSKYVDCAAIPACFEAKADSTKLGGFLGASGVVWRGLLVGGQIHMADFGTIEAIGPESGNLKGPLYSLYVGWEFGNWR